MGEMQRFNYFVFSLEKERVYTEKSNMSNSKRQADDARMSSGSSDDKAVSNDNASKCESDKATTAQ